MARIDHGWPSRCPDIVDLPLAGVAHEMVADGVVGGLWRAAPWPATVTAMTALSASSCSATSAERFDVRLLRIGDGVEIHRPDVALRCVGIGLRP